MSYVPFHISPSGLGKIVPQAASRALGILLACGVSGAPLAWETNGGYRSAALQLSKEGSAGFTLLPASTTGITFSNVLALRTHLTNQILLNGSGVAAGDIDGDGWCDLYFCGLDRPNVLYRNLGQWKFQDITAEAGVAQPNTHSTGAAFSDFEGDGDLDLWVNTCGNGTRLYLNDGHGHFALTDPPLNPGKCGTTLAFGDIDGDGFLDIYIANYRTGGLLDMPNAEVRLRTVNGRRLVATVNGRATTEPDLVDRFVVNERGGIEELGEVDVIYHNNGGTSLTPLTFTDGTFLDEDGIPLASPPFDWGLCVAFRDLNADGLPDLYVCNDFDSPDRIWINQGNGRFRAAPRLALRKTSLFSMGADFADVNRDGLDDLFVLDMLTRNHAQQMDTQPDRKAGFNPIGAIDNRLQYSYNTLQINRGDGTYAEIAAYAGVAAAEWAWSPIFLDVDLDGYEDLLISNGNERESRSLDLGEQMRAFRTGARRTAAEILEYRRNFPRLPSPNRAFRNLGNLQFEDKSDAWGFAFNGVSHGMALADLDNDGDLDVVINNLHAPASLLRNNSIAPRVAVRLKGKAPNTEGIGARITLLGGTVPQQSQEMMAGGRYASDDETIRVFAAGNASMTLEVLWRNGTRSEIRGVQPNRIYEIDESSAQSWTRPKAAAPPPWFVDASSLLEHTHEDELFDDFARQPLLPHRLSQLGPGVAWFDLDRDGWEDLIVGSGRGGKIGVFRNNTHGGFSPWKEPFLTAAILRDQTTVLGLHDSAGTPSLLIGTANYEDGQTNRGAADVYRADRNAPEEAVPATDSSPGPMALADLDGDGDLDLFIGGRCVAGRWPRPAASRLFRRDGDQWTSDTMNNNTLSRIGLVSGAVFTDLDGDGDPDLVVACEWGPLRIFRNDHGALQPWDFPLDPKAPAKMLSNLIGGWNSVSAGDFDGDGRMDLVAGNWGVNTRREMRSADDWMIYHGDFDHDGLEEVLEAFHDTATGMIVPEQRLDVVARAMPFVREKFTSNKAWGRASVEQILGDRLTNATQLRANWFRTSVFLNRGDHFQIKVLPDEAQWTPVFGIAVADFNADGVEDLFLAQNFFDSQMETPRYDAGIGLILMGQGNGEFTPVSGNLSGIKIYGEQRGCGVSDFDGNGTADLVVGQNGGATRLFKNQSRTGLRVILHGPPMNPRGVGAILRIGNDKHQSPAREVHAGAGYWSQDGAVQVFAPPAPEAEITTHWPGGRITKTRVSPGAREVHVTP